MGIVATLTDPALIAGVLAAGACFATVVTIASPLVASDRLGARLKEVAKRREELRKKSRAELNNPKGLQHKNASAFAKNMVDKLDLQKRLADDTLSDKLVRAGLRGQAAQTMFYFYRAALPIGFAVAALVYVMTVGGEMIGTQKLAIVVGALAAKAGIGTYIRTKLYFLV
jgi:tight adherence protein C